MCQLGRPRSDASRNRSSAPEICRNPEISRIHMGHSDHKWPVLGLRWLHWLHPYLLPCWSVILCVHGSDVSPIMCFDKKSVNLVALAKSVHMLAIRPPPSPSQSVSERLSATVSKLNMSMLTTSVNAVISFQTFKHCFTGQVHCPLPSKWDSVGLLRPDNPSVPSWSSSEKCPEGQALPETRKG